MSDDPNRDLLVSCSAFAIACVLVVLWLVGPCTPIASSNPVERLQARVKIDRDGLQGVFYAHGTVDSVEYFPRAGYPIARRDSAQLYVMIDGYADQPDSIRNANGSICGGPTLDASGNGQYEWLARIEALQFYKGTFVEAPGDTVRAGYSSGKFFRDSGAFCRVDYSNFAPVALTAWGAETLAYPDSEGFRVDDGARMFPNADTTRFTFDAPQRAGGVRYVLRTLTTWLSGSDRYLRVEVTRDTTALGALQP